MHQHPTPPQHHPLWLPPAPALRGLTVAIAGEHPLLDTVRAEARREGLTLVDDPGTARIALVPESPALPDAGVTTQNAATAAPTETFTLAHTPTRTTVTYTDGPGALYGWFAARRALLTHAPHGTATHRPHAALRMLNHWDNVDIHPHMGQVERGYAGGSIFFERGEVRTSAADLERIGDYGRALASLGINRISINNVNVHRREARLLTDDLPRVAAIAAALRPWGVRLHLSVSFSSPLLLGGLDTADPLDASVQAFWRDAADRVYRAIPDFGGFVIKADSEGQPGPFAYQRSHADGANLLARALSPHGGLVHWRAFVYNHRQDWRDRSTDRARAAYDHFAPLDGEFDDNVIVQVKHGPMDFQAREPVSPVLAALPRTRVALELQVTQEYTGHQKHAVYLGRAWAEILRFAPFAGPAVPGRPSQRAAGASDTRTIADLATGGITAVANIGDDACWTGHPLAQANLYAYGRLAWDPQLDPIALLDEWIALTFAAAPSDPLAATLHSLLDDSWETYESYTAPLGVGFMVTPHTHYGPSVDGYEYSPWGTYHFADRDGIGVDRTVATGTGFAGQYPEPWARAFERPGTTPDALLLFFHHVPYTHELRSGATVIQHIYDTHFEGVERVRAMVDAWEAAAGGVDPGLFERVRERLAEQLRSAIEWRDQINTYFWRASGIPDARGRTLY
ncbi:alpha-glucuronidase [Micrococcales bacterium 31B]|nr:alpha-glucuronidase [Micrococcales bacterium 31B]